MLAGTAVAEADGVAEGLSVAATICAVRDGDELATISVVVLIVGLGDDVCELEDSVEEALELSGSRVGVALVSDRKSVV